MVTDATQKDGTNCLGRFLNHANLSKQRKAESTWARRKTHISTPVATTTKGRGAGWEGGSHDLERNPSDAGWASDKSPVDLQSQEKSKLCS